MNDLSRIDRHERRLAILRELAERGLALAKIAARRVLHDPARGDLGETYLKLAHEIRQTIALEARLEAEGRAAGLVPRPRLARLDSARPPFVAEPRDRPRDDEIN